MGYAFTLERPHDDVAVPCAFNGDQMNYVRLVMIEAGAVAGGGFESPTRPAPGLEITEQTLPISLFLSNDGWHITPDQAAFVAGRLRRAVAGGVVSLLMDFLDDAPDRDDVLSWVEEFAAFNEGAAAQDGYFVC